jgi:hypothetical protein
LNFGVAIDVEAIEAMVRNIEHAALVVAGLIALAAIACNWNDT